MAINNLESLLTPPALHISKEKEQTPSYHYCSPTRNSSTSTTASMDRDIWGMQPQSLTVIKKRRCVNGQSTNSGSDQSAPSQSMMGLDSPEQSELALAGLLFNMSTPLKE